MEELLKLPPNSLEAEQSVLGSIFIDPDAIAIVYEYIPVPSYFYSPAHQIIYSAVLELFNLNVPIDIVTVTEKLKTAGKLEEVGGSVYVTSLAGTVPTTINVAHYARLVREKAVLRQLINVSNKISDLCYQSKDTAEQILDMAQSLIFEIAESGHRKGFVSIKKVVADTFDKLSELYDKKEHVTGIPTYFKALDRLTSGFHPSELIIIAARPSMGKTAFAVNIATNAAINKNLTVAIFSLEMSAEQLVQRILCSLSGIDGNKLRTGFIKESDWGPLTFAAGKLSEAPIFIDDTPGITPLELRAKARRLKADKGLDVIIVDYLQLMSSTKGDSRQQELSEISRALKSIARELDIPVIALSQLNRSCESRNDKRPLLSDLRESGSLEQDADVVIVLYRDDYYNPETSEAGISEVIIRKQRNGPVGTVKLLFQKEYTRFADLELSYSDDEIPDEFEVNS